MLNLYPEITPRLRHSLNVGAGHQLHIEEFGRSDGLPVIVLHGGPGSGCESFQARFFDPAVYRIILFDQRGCGRSTPHASLEANTTWDLIADMESIRELLGLDQWLLFGGSWGATLALTYAETYPERVLGMLLRGIFLGRPRDIHWLVQEGANYLFPDYWQDFLAPIPSSERKDLLHAYHRRLTGEDEVARMAAAKAWSTWEARISTLRPNSNVVEHFAKPFLALGLARLECHYFVNHCFLEQEQLIKNIACLQRIPTVIVHGRHDVVTPLEQAYALHRAWPQAEFHIIADAGHSALEPGITDALVRACNEMPGRLK